MADLSVKYNMNRTNKKTGITVTKFFDKSIEIDMTLKQSATRYKQKTETFLVTRPPRCWKFDSSFWILRKDNFPKGQK